MTLIGELINIGDFASTWTVTSLEAALAAPATSEQRRSLVAACREGYIDLRRGLAAIPKRQRFELRPVLTSIRDQLREAVLVA